LDAPMEGWMNLYGRARILETASFEGFSETWEEWCLVATLKIVIEKVHLI